MKDFWENVSRYPRYFITFTLGIFFSIFGWLKPLLKNPVSAIALLGIVLGGGVFVLLTLRGMLGLGGV
ncbi:DUF751 family protein [Spirulina subsalsa FACHB-351]|uniref:DUF751 family protein n=1 Tax=Spirulina subsalsa FACHB-351 TaxID=234711 RepID=A0ABT3L239_9CYAN|nr:DUF751 family protein [Spirulina subsalsa]MCW6035543.1 DUF751 family protein [Spirulina subsalsa FACHB-351]